ncbi:hypothetical protein PENSPDRAFT_357489 [Peniophora sp. CONT]|nr:hypothetical protein PENSPDRAFT_357489 [Peniophora sp. CONT]
MVLHAAITTLFLRWPSVRAPSCLASCWRRLFSHIVFHNMEGARLHLGPLCPSSDCSLVCSSSWRFFLVICNTSSFHQLMMSLPCAFGTALPRQLPGLVLESRPPVRCIQRCQGDFRSLYRRMYTSTTLHLSRPQNARPDPILGPCDCCAHRQRR